MSGRQSILMRKTRTPSSKNDERLDVQHGREQARLEAKRRRYESIGKERMKFIDGDYRDKIEIQEETRREMETHLALQEEQKKKELITELQLSSTVEEQAALMSSVEEDRERARAELARRVMEENRRLIEEKKRQEEEERRKEEEWERSTVDFFQRIPRSFR